VDARPPIAQSRPDGNQHQNRDRDQRNQWNQSRPRHLRRATARPGPGTHSAAIDPFTDAIRFLAPWAKS
jgi:hypothetical protein